MRCAYSRPCILALLSLSSSGTCLFYLATSVAQEGCLMQDFRYSLGEVVTAFRQPLLEEISCIRNVSNVVIARDD